MNLARSFSVSVSVSISSLALGLSLSTLVYNICPALTPPDKPFVTWSGERSPFSREQWKAAGFKVNVFDQDDTEAVRVMGHALGWGDDPEDHWDIDHDLSVISTLVERPR